MFQNISVKEAFPFIRQMLSDAFRTDAQYYTSPYEELDKIDRGFRSMVWGSSQFSRSITYLNTLEHYHLIVVQSTLSFYNLIAIVTLGETPDFINIGPFLDGGAEAKLHELILGRSLSAKQAFAVRNFYQSLPSIDTSDIVTMTLHLISAILPEYNSVQPEYINYLEDQHHFVHNDQNVFSFDLDTAERFAADIRELMAAVTAGDISLCNKPLKKLLTNTGFYVNTAGPRQRKILSFLNNQCFCSLMSSPVHPMHVLRLFTANEKLYDAVSGSKRLSRLPSEIVHKYCLLVKNYSYPDYSYLIRNVINYITLHLDEPLSLSVIAEHYHKNPCYLSSQFHKEAGCSLTEYVRRERIHASLRYMNTTDLSIAEIAVRVGVPDFSYFTRLFTRQIGCSPSEYKKLLKSGKPSDGISPKNAPL